MNNKDYRELQLTSTQLIFIVVAIPILGLVIFILGVSVGKKQAQLVSDTELTPKEKPTVRIEETIKPAETQKSNELISKELESHEKVKEEVQKPTATPTTIQRNLYYIQIGAFSSRENAINLADQYKKRGYSAVVKEPSPTARRKLYRVRIGGYRTKEEAERISTKLTEESSSKERYLIVRE